MDSSTIFYLFFSIIIIPTCTLILVSNLRKHQKSLPPGPYSLPIIGNILDLGPKPHRKLAQLSKTSGPIMSLNLGSTTTLIVSSPQLAKELLQKNEQLFHSRRSPGGVKALDHHKHSMVWLPVGPQWRKLRKLSKEHMFSIQRLDKSQSLRADKLRALCDYVTKCSGNGKAVEIGKAAFTTSLNLLSNTLFSVDFAAYESDSSGELREIVWGVMESVGRPNVVDYFPVLDRFDPQGVRRRVEFYFGKLLEIFDGIIRERIELRSRGLSMKNDLLEVVLDLKKRDESDGLSWNEIKHLFLDLFVAGTDTTSSTVEWAMAELLHNPEKLSKTKIELQNIIGFEPTSANTIQESDISRLPYLQAVVKETLRLHPTVPFLFRKPESAAEIGKFSVPKDSQVLVNLWAIGHDSDIWPNPDCFMPERFLGQGTKDFKGQDFELLPFGTGRRICPGLPLAYRTVHLMVASLVHNFEWEVEPGEMDMSEKFGLSLQKAVPLMAVPVKN